MATFPFDRLLNTLLLLLNTCRSNPHFRKSSQLDIFFTILCRTAFVRDSNQRASQGHKRPGASDVKNGYLVVQSTVRI
ncbi:hypothetical protein GQ44DRAFT_373756 [Phaeosphaeriaceae sp. PMI808]|nr:hypothetical protein GQ44DRAFT_373756 [Phaeosphaeriaceae sp. PMI808]